MRGRRHHRGDLLGSEGVVVSRDAGALAGQVLREQSQLIAQGPVQLDLAVGAPDHFHALLELLRLAGADRDGERGPQQRRPAGGLQVGQQVASLLGALVAEVGNSLVTVGLGPHDLIGVLDPPPCDPQRERVGQIAGIQGEIDAERQALGRGEHELDPDPGEARLLGERAQHQLRLPAGAQLGLDAQAPELVLDIGVHPAQHVTLQRRQQRLAVALEHECSGLVQAVDLGLPETAAERAPDEPLQLDAPGRPDGQEAGQPRVDLIGLDACPLELCGREHGPLARREGAPERSQPVSRSAFRGLRHIRGDVPCRLLEADNQKHDGPGLADVGQSPRVLLQVLAAHARARVRVLVLITFVLITAPISVLPSALLAVLLVATPRAAVTEIGELGLTHLRAAGAFQLGDIALELPCAAHSHDLQVGFDRLDRAEQLQQARSLAVLGQPLIRAGLHRKCRPAVVECASEQDVAVHERNRRPERHGRPRRGAIRGEPIDDLGPSQAGLRPACAGARIKQAGLRRACAGARINEYADASHARAR